MCVCVCVCVSAMVDKQAVDILSFLFDNCLTTMLPWLWQISMTDSLYTIEGFFPLHRILYKAVFCPPDGPHCSYILNEDIIF